MTMRFLARVGNEVGKRYMSYGGRTALHSSNAWQRYNHYLTENPIVTKSITAGIIAFVADIVCQAYFPSNAEDAKKPIKERINWQRTVNFTFLNSIIVPPMMHFWYGFLSTKIVGSGIVAAAKRVAVDQTIYAPLFIPVFLAATLFMEGKPDLIADKLRADWWNTLKVNYGLWIPAQLINFSVVPPPFRVLWANLVGFFWNIYLSGAANRKVDSDQSDPSFPFKDKK